MTKTFTTQDQMTFTADGSTITASWEMITPEVADQMLLFNTHNRQLKKRHVAALAADMQTGFWAFNGATISFSAEPVRLLDGQNRLQAVVESRVPIMALVLRGLKPTSQINMDTGVKRTFADTLKLNGYPNNRNLAALTRFAYAWERGERRTLRAVDSSNERLMAFLAGNPDLVDMAGKLQIISSRYALNPTAMRLAYWLFQRRHPNDNEGFWRQVSEGVGSPGDPIYALRRSFERVLDESRRGRATRPEYQLGITIKAWNAWLDGYSVKHLTLKMGGDNPQPFPEPI